MSKHTCGRDPKDPNPRFNPLCRACVVEDAKEYMLLKDLPGGCPNCGEKVRHAPDCVRLTQN